jgi:uncharacterized membrane protein
LWRADVRERIIGSLWFLPTVSVVGAILLAEVTDSIDERVDAPVGARHFLISDPTTAAVVAGTIAAATLAFVAVVFATTLVAIQLAASQYSPRAVRIFIRSRVTRVTLGIFLATFVFAVATLIGSRANLASPDQFAPVVSISVLVALTIGTVLGFVAYLHGVVRLMRVQYLLAHIADETRAGIVANFPPGSAYVDVDAPRPDLERREVRHRGPAGVISAIDEAGLVALCQQRGCWLELSVHVGEYLAYGTVIGRVHDGCLDEGDISRLLLVRGERTFLQDPGFGIRQLVDIAIRALSPAVNDPTTAVQAIDRLNDLLVVAGLRSRPRGLRVDSDGVPRLLLQVVDFEALLRLSLTEIIRYGADSPQVIRRLHALLDELDGELPDEDRVFIVEHRQLLSGAVAAALPAPFAAVAVVADRRGLG